MLLSQKPEFIVQGVWDIQFAGLAILTIFAAYQKPL